MKHISSYLKSPWSPTGEKHPKQFVTKLDLYDLHQMTKDLLIEVMQSKYGNTNQSELTLKLKVILANLH